MDKIKAFRKTTKFKISGERIGERLDIEAPRGARFSIIPNMSGLGYHLLNEGSRINRIPESEEQIIERLVEFIREKQYLVKKT